MDDRIPLRSGSGSRAGWVGFGPFAFDRSGEQLLRDGVEVHLAPRAAAVLRELTERLGETVTKDELLEVVWNGTAVTEDALTQAVSLVRQALGDDARQPLYVETVARQGYRFVGSIEEIDSAPPLAADTTSATGGQASRFRDNFRRIVTTMALVAAAASAGWLARRTPSGTESGPARFIIHAPAGVELPSARMREALAISPDGRYVAFVGDRGGERRIYLRDLQAFDVVPVGPDVGIDLRGAGAVFFSPDGAWIDFARGEGFWRIPRDGGAPVAIIEEAHNTGAAWLRDGRLLYRWNRRLWLRQQDGGEPRQLGDGNFVWPQVLPGDHYAIAAWNRWGRPTAYDASLFVIDLETGQQRELPFRGTAPRYAASGHLVFAREGALFAVPFDIDSAEPHGAPVRVLDGVATWPDNGVPSFAIAANGTLIYRPVAGPTRHQVAWIDAEGNVDLIAEGDPHAYSAPSPDGRYVALARGVASADLWLYETERGTERRLFPPGVRFAPVWSPDSRRLFYSSWGADRVRRLMVVDPRSPDTRRSLLEGPLEAPIAEPTFVWSVHPDGERLAYAALMRGTTGYDVRILDTSTDSEPYTLLGAEFDESMAAFSPDGNWMAYVSDETGRHEVYVTDFPGARRSWRVSTRGGTSPRWSPDMQALYYQESSRIMRAAMRIADGPRLSPPELVIDAGLAEDFYSGFDLSADGTRFLVVTKDEPAPMHQINVVLSWFAELERLVPVGR